MDAFTEYVLLLGISVGAHVGVAYGLAPRAATRRVEQFFGSDRGHRVLGDAVDQVVLPKISSNFPVVPSIEAFAAPIKDEIRAQLAQIKIPTVEEIRASIVVPTPEQFAQAIEIPSVGEELASWTKTPEGQAWVRDLASSVGAELGRRTEEKVQGVLGGLARKDAAKIEELLLRMRFGIPMLDGVWGMAMGDDRIRKSVARTVEKVLRQAGGMPQVIDGESREIDSLTDGNSDGEQYV